MHKIFAMLRGFKLYNFTGCGPGDHNIFSADFIFNERPTTMFLEFMNNGSSNPLLETRGSVSHNGNGSVEDIYLNRSEPNY